MLREVEEAKEVECHVEKERKQQEEEERQKAEEKRWRAEEKAEEKRKQAEAEQAEVGQLWESLELYEKGLQELTAEEMAEVTAELAEQAWKVQLGEGSSGPGPCWHCQSWKTECIHK